jgi:hypothetical protein
MQRRSGQAPRGGSHVPRGGAPCTARLRHRIVQRLGRRHASHARRGVRRLVHRRGRGTDWRSVPLPTDHGAGRVHAYRPVCPGGDHLSRQRHCLRPALRLGGGRLPSRAVERARHLRTTCRHVQRRGGRHPARPVQRGGSPSRTFAKARRQCDPDHAGGPVRGRAVVGGTTPPISFRWRSPMEALWRSSGSSSAHTSRAWR